MLCDVTESLDFFLGDEHQNVTRLGRTIINVLNEIIFRNVNLPDIPKNRFHNHLRGTLDIIRIKFKEKF